VTHGKQKNVTLLLSLSFFVPRQVQ